MIRKIQLPLLVGAALIILLLYWMGTSFGRFTFPRGDEQSPFVLLSRALLEGKLSVALTPDPELLALPNPYDPGARGTIPYPWDLSLYDGRFFVYWGPVSVLLLYIPWYLISGVFPNEHLVIFLLTSLTTIAITATSYLGARRLDLPRGSVPALWLLYCAFAGPFPLQLGGGVYVVAALSAIFFQVACAASLILFLTSTRHRHIYALASGLTLILAIACRPTLALFGICATVVILYGSSALSRRARLSLYGVFILPLLVGGSMLLAYNYARYGSPFELGTSYQLSRVDLSHATLCSFTSGYSLSLALLQLWYHFASPPLWVNRFPYVMYFATKPQFLEVPAGYVGNDAVTGLIPTSPLLIIGTIGLAMYATKLSRPARVTVVGLLASAGASTLFLSSCRFAAARYAFEIYAPWLICSVWGCWLLSHYVQGTFLRPLVRTTIVITLLATVCIGILGTFDGHFFKHISPQRALRAFAKVTWDTPTASPFMTPLRHQ